MVVLQELDQQGLPNVRCFNRGSAATRFSMSSSVSRKVQPREQLSLIESLAKFRNFAMEDNNVESTMVPNGHWRDLSLSLTLVYDVTDAEPVPRTLVSCDARRYSHGSASGSSRRMLSRDGKVDGGTTGGGSWAVTQWDRFGSWARWWVAASDRRPLVWKLLSDSPHRQT